MIENQSEADVAAKLSMMRIALHQMCTGKPLTYVARLFLVEGLTAFIEGDGQVSLDQSFGLRRPGGISTRQALKNATRNEILQQLMRNHPEWSGLAPSVVSRRMRKAFDQYESGRYQRDRKAVEPPAAEPFTSFWRLLKTDMSMPKIDRLRQILSRNSLPPLNSASSPRRSPQIHEVVDAERDD